MKDMSWIPEGVDTSKPSPARVYDYLLGGNHNFEADRAAAEKIIEVSPQNPRKAVWICRRFLRQTVRICLDAGVTQFLDLGSGLPTIANVHETAQKTKPESRVLYVDVDPVAYGHSRKMLESNPRAAVVNADLRDVDKVLNAPETNRLLDFDQPIALIMAAVLHFIPDSENPTGLIKSYTNRFVSGSYLAITHGNDDETLFREGIKVYKQAVANSYSRSRTEIEAFFDGFELIEPGVAWLEDWPHDPLEMPIPDPPTRFAYAGIGRKP